MRREEPSERPSRITLVVQTETLSDQNALGKKSINNFQRLQRKDLHTQT